MRELLRCVDYRWDFSFVFFVFSSLDRLVVAAAAGMAVLVFLIPCFFFWFELKDCILLGCFAGLLIVRCFLLLVPE